MSAILTLVAALFAAWLLGRLARAVGLPAVVGMLAGGALVGAGLGPWMQGVGMPASAPTAEQLARPVRLAALALVLLRAGLGLSWTDLRGTGPLAVRLGLLPMAADALAVALGVHFLLSLSFPVALVMGFTVAALSPAIVIPGLLRLRERCGGDRHRTVTALLAGAPLDNLAAVVLLGVSLDLALGQAAGLWPALGGLAVDVAGGLVLGGLGGWAAARVVGIWRRGTEWVAWAGAGGLVGLAEWLGVSSVLAVLAAGMVLAASLRGESDSLKTGLTRLWSGVQLVLFALVGLSVDLGPLRDVGPALVAAIALGQLGRLAGSWLATCRAAMATRDRRLAVAAYIPKATIQAAFGGLALERGLAEGELIQTAAVLAIVLCAPLGATLLGRASTDVLRSSPRRPA
jgi:NhaP-type Na+/H+ or K+/H+ antiporter